MRILAKQINNLEHKNSEDYSFNIFELDVSNNSVEDIRKINQQVRIPPKLENIKFISLTKRTCYQTLHLTLF